MKYLQSDVQKIKEGLYEAADAVSSTLGPEGMNVFIEEKFAPRITNDGARIANSLNLEDPLRNAGAYFVKSVSAKQNDDAGDGTTTASLFLQAILKESEKEDVSPAVLRREIMSAARKAISLLEPEAQKVEGKEEIKKVALVSAEYSDVAELIAEAHESLGKDAFITVEDSKDDSTALEKMRGYELNAGYLSPYFITDFSMARSVLEDCQVAVFSKKVANINHLTRVLDVMKSTQNNRLALFVDEIDDRVLGFLVQNKQINNIEVVVVHPLPEALDDIAGITGATIIGSSGVEFRAVKEEHLGKAEKIITTNASCLILTDPIKANNQAMKIAAEAQNEDNMYLKERLEKRAARLRGEIAVLKIGAANDMSREHKKDKADDAIHSVRAALAEGTVAGAGIAWKKVAKQMEDSTKGRETAGDRIVRRSILYPSAILGTTRELPDVRDALLVEKNALLNAAEAAGIFLTTKYALIEKNDEKNINQS